MHGNVPVRFGRGRLDSLGSKGLAAYLIGCAFEVRDIGQSHRGRLVQRQKVGAFPVNRLCKCDSQAIPPCEAHTIGSDHSAVCLTGRCQRGPFRLIKLSEVKNPGRMRLIRVVNGSFDFSEP